MAPINQLLNKSINLADDVAKYVKACGKTSVLQTKPVNPNQLKELRLATDMIGDTVSVVNKSPMAEFQEYLRGYKMFGGEDFIPTSNNPNSLFMEYFNYRKSVCKPKPATPSNNKCTFSFGALKASPKIIKVGDNSDNYLSSLNDFLIFIRDKSEIATKEQFYALVDEYASLMPKYFKENYPDVRPEISENMDKITKWMFALGQEDKGVKKGEIVYKRFFDQQRKNTALKEYVEFVENLTGKKVLIGSPTRMGFATTTVTLYNDPKVYQDFDYILWGHGTGSSLASIDDPNKWRFSDSGEGIYEFLEKQPNAKGKKVLVICCEEDGDYWRARGKYSGKDSCVPLKLKREYPEMYDKKGEYMKSLGKTVCASLNHESGAKICEIGRRQVIGTVGINGNMKHYDPFIQGCTGDFETKYFNL